MAKGAPFGSEPPTAAELKAERKRARRKQRRLAERAAARQLDALASDAVEAALALVADVAGAPSTERSETAVDVAMPSRDAAVYAQRRINEALAVGEWLDDVETRVWEAEAASGPPLTDHGASTGVEVRLRRR